MKFGESSVIAFESGPNDARVFDAREAAKAVKMEDKGGTGFGYFVQDEPEFFRDWIRNVTEETQSEMDLLSGNPADGVG